MDTEFLWLACVAASAGFIGVSQDSMMLGLGILFGLLSIRI